MLDVPSEGGFASSWERTRARFRVSMSERRFESLDCWSIVPGFRVRTTTTLRMAMTAITIRSSIKVKALRERMKKVYHQLRTRLKMRGWILTKSKK
jgi:hypothetical protein